MLATGKVGEYEWVQCANSGMFSVIHDCPEVLMNKCVVVASFDWGPLKASADELKKGWEQHGALVVIPSVTSPNELPYEGGDEWYIFAARTIPDVSETFVNDGFFTLKEPHSLIDEAVAALGSNADVVGAKYRAAQLAARQGPFWSQMNNSRPESYIASGESFIFASRDNYLFRNVVNALSAI